MEIGAVVGAVPEANVRREQPVPGDVVIPVSYTHLDVYKRQMM